MSAALLLINDPTMQTITPNFALQLCEVVQQLTILKSNSYYLTQNINFNPSFVPGLETIPVSNLRTSLTNYFLFKNIRKSGKSLDETNINMILPFEDAWSTTGEQSEFYFGGNNLLFLRRSYSTTVSMSVTFIPYVSVVNLEDEIVLTDDYKDALRCLFLCFLFIRTSRFELAKQQLELWAKEVDDADSRRFYKRRIS